MKFVTFDDAVRVREDAHGFDSHVFFGDRKHEGPGPQIYMNAVDPGVKLAAHFHRIDQFQVFFGGDESIFQRRPIPSVFLHYTDAYSSYGPFAASAETSLLYATIRARSDNYGGVMPGARKDRPHNGGRQMSAEVQDWAIDTLPSQGAHEVLEVFAAESDGLAAGLVRLGPNTEYTPPPADATAGRTFCVLDGTLRTSGSTFESRSIGWQGRDDSPNVMHSGDEGCSILVLDFPWPPTGLGAPEAG
ncbi:hypothetical protein [Rhodococcus globerulus]|uniref:Uncharacterized protein n=1 Tax=Rhodococcus globerulus TaxID=33008 RepID=A0ABU4C4B8_RHOGO|nr:hypothetical protein [Rhodococcus globerulus]MDV6271348.1 hypothetical protein [Rhodococcus globerulus]